MQRRTFKRARRKGDAITILSAAAARQQRGIATLRTAAICRASTLQRRRLPPAAIPEASTVHITTNTTRSDSNETCRGSDQQHADTHNKGDPNYYPWGVDMLSIPCITILEQARLIADRAKLLASGAPPMLLQPSDVGKVPFINGWKCSDVVDMARAELFGNAMPLVIERTLDDGTVVVVNPNKLMKCDT